MQPANTNQTDNALQFQDNLAMEDQARFQLRWIDWYNSSYSEENCTEGNRIAA
jgi:hypothetical protein